MDKKYLLHSGSKYMSTVRQANDATYSKFVRYKFKLNWLTKQLHESATDMWILPLAFSFMKSLKLANSCLFQTAAITDEVNVG